MTSHKPPCVTVAILEIARDAGFAERVAALRGLVKQQLVTLDKFGLFGLVVCRRGGSEISTLLEVSPVALSHLHALDQLQPSLDAGGPSDISDLVEHALPVLQSGAVRKVGGLRLVVLVSEISRRNFQGLSPAVARRVEGMDVTLEIAGFPQEISDLAEQSRWLTSKYVQQRAKTQCSLVLAEDVLEISVHIFCKTRRDLGSGLTFEKFSPDERLPDGRLACVKNRRVLYDSQGREVKAEICKAARIGPDAILDVDELKLETKRELKLIATVKKNKIFPSSDADGPVDVVIAEPGNLRSSVALRSFLRALVDADSVALARFCYRATAEPRLVALVPEIDGTSAPTLLLVPLAFSDDRREPWRVTQAAAIPGRATESQTRAMREFLNETPLGKLHRIGNLHAQRIMETLFLRLSTGNEKAVAEPHQVLRNFAEDVSDGLEEGGFEAGTFRLSTKN